MLNSQDAIAIQQQEQKQIYQENHKFVSIIIPTFNESKNIINLLDQIQSHVPRSLNLEIIVVDDNSPDGTGIIVEKYIQEKKKVVDDFSSSSNIVTPQISSISHLPYSISIKIIHRKKKNGLIAAVLNGIKSSKGQNIIVMDADFSHPPQVVRKMISELKKEPNCIVVGSRYVKGGKIKGMSLGRYLLSMAANFIARHGLSLKNVCDPMSGFFAFPKHALHDIEFNTNGFKILLEILIKKKNTIRVKEIPYTFEVRKYGCSKLDKTVVIEYMKAIWKLYRYGRKSKGSQYQEIEKEKMAPATWSAAAATVVTGAATGVVVPKTISKIREIEAKGAGEVQERWQNLSTKDRALNLEQKKSVRFISKAARFYTVGASGFVLNYLVSMLLSNGTIANLDYLHAVAIGIGLSVTTNFLLNKFWTFEDKIINMHRFLKQYGSFIGCSSLGIIIQFLSVYLLKESGMTYDISLFIGVTIASVSNFLFNKKLTFKEKIWG